MGKKGEKMKDLLAKPNQLIEVEGTLNLSQLKTYNVILSEVHNIIQRGKKSGEMTENSTLEEYIIDYKNLKKRSGITEKNDKRLREWIRSIRKVDISLTDKKNKGWAETGLLSQVTYEEGEGKLYVSIPLIIRKSLYASNYYTTLDLLLIKTLKSKYSVILYELLKKYEGVQIPKYEIESFSKVFQTKYKNFYDIKRYILDIAISEIEEKTDYTVSYETSKVGRKISYIKLKCEKKRIKVLDDTLEAEIVEEPLMESEETALEKAISKAKKNIYISKAWNKRADNKVKAVLDIHGEDYVVDMLKRAYNGCQREIEKTLVQYFNGIIKNMKLDAEEVQEKEQKKAKTKEKLITRPIEVREEPKEVQSVDYYVIFERLNKDVQDDILKQAREMYLEETKTPSFDTIHEKIFNVAKKVYINRILG